jgi:hypothetical protein
METTFTISNGTLTFVEGTEVIDLTFLEKTESVEKIIIPATAIEMSGLPTIPLYDLPNLKYIIVEEGNPIFDSRENCNAVIETATNTLMMGCVNSVIPSTVVAIYDNAFTSCYELKELNLPENVKMIYSTAFSNCFGLKSIVIPKTVQLVDSFAFEGCENLEMVTFEGKDTKLGDDVFRYCHKLSKILVPNAAVEKYKEQLGEELQNIVIGA